MTIVYLPLPVPVFRRVTLIHVHYYPLRVALAAIKPIHLAGNKSHLEVLTNPDVYVQKGYISHQHKDGPRCTGLTNFDHKDIWYYQEAIRQWNLKRLPSDYIYWLSDKPMGGSYPGGDMGSLHFNYDNKEVRSTDCTPFWQIFKTIKYGKTPVERYVNPGYFSYHRNEGGTGLTNFNWKKDLGRMQRAIDYYNYIRYVDDPIYWLSDKSLIGMHQDQDYGSLHVEYGSKVTCSSKFWDIYWKL